MTGQLEQTPKEWLSLKSLTGGVRGNRPGVSEDSDDSKVSFWLEQWLAQSWDSDICWHKRDKGEKNEWLERMARERKKLSIVQSSEVNGLLASHFLQDRPVKSSEWCDPSWCGSCLPIQPSLPLPASHLCGHLKCCSGLLVRPSLIYVCGSSQLSHTLYLPH